MHGSESRKEPPHRQKGFEVVDLGVDVSPSKFVEKAVELKPHIEGVSALLTPSLEGQRKLVEAL